MQKLLNISKWIWANKERMILIVMLCLLGYKVYEVVKDPGEIEFKSPPTVSTVLNEEKKELLELPPMPIAPPIRAPEDWTSLYRNNMFWYYSGASKQSDATTEEQADITLVRIRTMPNGAVLAQLQTSSDTRWYREGDVFQQYEVLSIDPDAQTCEVRSERLGRVLTLTVE